MVTLPGAQGRQLRQLVREHVEGLGDRADAVADRLVAEGIRGVQQDKYDCPVARYLQAVVGADPSIWRLAVLYGRIRISQSPSSAPIYVRAPRALHAFVRAFDAGRYPDLVDGHPGKPAPADTPPLPTAAP